MLTLNNPTFKESEVIYELGHHEQLKYMCWCAENEDLEDHTPHYHIYVSFTRMWRFSRIKELLPRARIEMAKKPELACFRYLTKGDREHSVEPFYMEFGHHNQRDGSKGEKRKAADESREKVLWEVAHKRIRFEDLTEEQLLDSKLCNAVERVLKVISGPWRERLHVCCFVSPTGWGKSYAIWDTFKEVTTVEFGGTQEWFIQAEKDVCLFDEFCGQVRCQKMLKYLDIYPISLPVKGGHRPCWWKAIFVCSNTRPDEWYTRINEKTGLRESTIPQDVRDALYRRLGYNGQQSITCETHVYDPMFYTKEQARQEMKQICLRIKDHVDMNVEVEEIRDSLPDSEHDQNSENPLHASELDGSEDQNSEATH